MKTDSLSEHVAAPRHRGRLAGATGSYVHFDPASGDALRIQVRVERGHLAELRFGSFGNPVLAGIASFLSENLTGCPLEVLSKVTLDYLVESLGLKPPEVGLARLVLVTLLDAVQDHRRRQRPELEVGP